MTDTKIEWAERVWNPLAGCTIKSPGCTNCYAMKMAKRCEAMGIAKYAGTTKTVNGKAVWTGKINFDENALLAPLKRKKPTVYFVNSMSDLFHEDVPDEQIDMVFAVMALCSHHTFQVLTKRADRMREYCDRLTSPAGAGAVIELVEKFKPSSLWNGNQYQVKYELAENSCLPNVWLGVSVEDQKRADERIPDLLATPAAVRWLSCEPLLGAVRFYDVCNGAYFLHPLTGQRYHDAPDGSAGASDFEGNSIDWIVVGGESGPGAREFDPDWARLIRDQCAAAGVPFFMKQMGGANKARMPEIPGDLMVREYPNAIRR